MSAEPRQVEHGADASPETDGRLAESWAVLRGAVAASRADGVPMIAQALAYSLFLAIPAVFLVALGVFSLVADPTMIERLIARSEAVVPAEVASLLRDSLERTAASSGSGLLMTVVGLGLALWTLTSAATTLMEGITRTYDRSDERSFVHKRLVALAIVACLGLAALLVLGMLVLGPHLQRWVGDALGAQTLTTWVWWTAQWPILVLGLLGAFSALLYLGPDVQQRRWRFVTPGAVAALVIWLAASSAFAFYSGRFGSYEKTWGTLSAVVVMLIWLWVTGAALLFGAEVNAEADRRSDRRPLPAQLS